VSCCNHNCAQGRTCPLRQDEGLHEVNEFQPFDWIDGILTKGLRALAWVAVGMALLAALILLGVGRI